METLETPETLSKLPPEPGTLDTRPRRRRDPESTVPAVSGSQPATGARGRGRSPSLAAAAATKSPAPETLTPASVSSNPELGLGLPSSESKRSSFGKGDLVWAKGKSRPWWPGEVLDPSADVAEAPQRNPSVVVALFGRGHDRCEPSQVKPFGEEFELMARQSSSRSFVGAVKEALAKVERCLDLQMTCYCVPEEERRKLGRERRHLDGVGGLPVKKHLPGEFLRLVCDAAQDVLVIDMLEVTVLRSWVTAFRRGMGCTAQLDGEILGQVDQNVVLVRAGDSSKDKVEEERHVVESRVGKGPETTEDVNQRRKERTITELIADPRTVAQPDDKEAKAGLGRGRGRGCGRASLSRERKKKGESSKGSDGVNGNVVAVEVKISDLNSSALVAVEETGSGRRERKKSKYLSPPYMYLSGHNKRLVFPKDTEVEPPKKEPKASQSSSSGLHPISKCNGEVSQKGEDKIAPLLQSGSTSLVGILSEFLATAINPLHLKWNRSAKEVRDLFDKFRSSVYSEGSEFEGYQKFLLNLGSADRNLLQSSLGDGSGIGGSSRKRIKRNDRINGERVMDSGHGINDQTETNKLRRRRKMGREKANVEPPATLAPSIVNGSEQVKSGCKRRSSKGGSVVETPVHVDHELTNSSKEGKLVKRTKRSKSTMNGETPGDTSHGLVNQSASNLRKKRKSKSEPSDQSLAHSGHKTNNNSEGGRTRQKRKKTDRSNYRNPAALILTFAPGATLPSRDELISTFSKYGLLIEPETDSFKDSHYARIVFASGVDAEKIVNSSDKSGVYGTLVAKYEVHHLAGDVSPSSLPTPQKTPLPYIRKGLERMISKLAGASSHNEGASSSGCLKPEVTENLVGEMEGLLKKVQNLITGRSAPTVL